MRLVKQVGLLVGLDMADNLAPKWRPNTHGLSRQSALGRDMRSESGAVWGAFECILKVDTMPNESTISKWGNSLAVRIPLAIAKQAGLDEGDSVTLALDRKGGVVLRPVRRKYALSELVARITPKNRHRETDWGPPRGKETW